MEKIAELIFMEMAEQLNSLQPNNIIERAVSSYNIVKDANRRLDNFIENYSFEDREEEIKFFKHIKPNLLKEQIYYSELYFMESLKPNKDKKSIEQYFNDHLKYNNQYFERNRNLYNYQRTGQTSKDHLLFVEKKEPDLLTTGGTIEKDIYIAQGHSSILARLQALELLNTYIQNEIHKLKHNVPVSNTAGALAWTAPKVALIELLYALVAIGAFNNGNADLKTIVNVFQDTFAINLGNYYSVIQQNIRIRKKNRTVFLDNLKDQAEKRMDDTDENPRFS